MGEEAALEEGDGVALLGEPLGDVLGLGAGAVVADPDQRRQNQDIIAVACHAGTGRP